jgi:chaperonin GroES
METHSLHNFVLVKRLESECKNIADVLLPDFSIEKINQGMVIAASAGTKLKNSSKRTLEIKIGDNILFGKHVGQQVKIDEDDLLIMRDDEIAAVLQA